MLTSMSGQSKPSTVSHLVLQQEIRQAIDSSIERNKSSRIKQIYIMNIKWNDNAAAIFAEILTSIIKPGDETPVEIALASGEISDNGLIVILNAVRKIPSLSMLDLSSITNLGDRGAEAVAHLIEGNLSLKRLLLKCGDMTEAGAKTITLALYNACLTELSLTQQRMGLGGAIHFADTLRINKKLRKLDLTGDMSDPGCGIGDAGTIAIARALECNSTLEHLNLAINFATDTGAKAFIKTLQKNTTLINLPIHMWAVDPHDITDESYKAIDSLLEKNQRLKHKGATEVSASKKTHNPFLDELNRLVTDNLNYIIDLREEDLIEESNDEFDKQMGLIMDRLRGWKTSVIKEEEVEAFKQQIQTMYQRYFKQQLIAATVKQNVVAQAYLGWAYETGNGVELNKKEALEWYRKAALKGHEYAQRKVQKLGADSSEKPEHSSNIPHIAWQTLELGTLLGNGSFGDVYRGLWRGKEVAIKILQLKTLAPHLAKDFEHEVQMMWQCQFPNTLTLHGVCTESGHYAMVTEYMSNGSLYQWLHSPAEIPESLRWQVAIDIAQGLADLHSQGILHRDLKSFNILLDSHHHARISDFGLAKLKLESRGTSTARTSSHSVGTVRWRAPELFKRKAETTPASDIYSYGMVLWELVTRKLPFNDAQDEPTVISWVSNGEKEDIPEDCPESWKQIIQSCWGTPDSRPNAAEIVGLLKSAKPRMPKAWHFEGKPDAYQVGDSYTLLPASGQDLQKVFSYYEHHAVPGFDVREVKVIYNPVMNRAFSLKMQMLQQRKDNPAFVPRWSQEDNAQWRAEVHQQWQKLTAPYQDEEYPEVKLIPLWHGTRPEILDSIFRTGYANLASTDSGFFGKGIYSAHEAEYAYRIYSKGALILNWVASYSAYPVIDSDMLKLSERANYQNYDTHFIPVVPANPHNPYEVTYLPTKSGQPHQYNEVVVFDNGQCLPRYLVTLQPVLTKALGTPVVTLPPISPRSKKLLPTSPLTGSSILSEQLKQTKKPFITEEHEREKLQEVLQTGGTAIVSQFQAAKEAYMNKPRDRANVNSQETESTSEARQQPKRST